MDSGTEGGELVEAVSRLVDSGGKRVRPAIVWFGHQACGGSHGDRAMLLAMACEFLHTYLLVHDDIMDHASVRRGEPTAHVEFQDLHARHRWSGDSQDYGRSVAILAGDLAGSWASEATTMALAGLESEQARQLSGLFFGMCQEVIWGQHLEMRAAARREADEQDLARVLRLKSGCYTVERPLQLGAALAGAKADVLEHLARYGAALGEAFQLRDDLLGTFGDEAAVGKPVGGDITEGKFTFIIYHALRQASPSQAQVIHGALGDPELSEGELARTCDLLEALGARAAVEGMVSERLIRSEEALRAVEGRLEPEGYEALEGLISYLGDRRS